MHRSDAFDRPTKRQHNRLPSLKETTPKNQYEGGHGQEFNMGESADVKSEHSEDSLQQV